MDNSFLFSYLRSKLKVPKEFALLQFFSRGLTNALGLKASYLEN